MTRATRTAGSKKAARHESARLFIEHERTELHTGDAFFEGCPVCDQEMPFPKSLKRLIIKMERQEVG